jgi:hypothetical protein
MCPAHEYTRSVKRKATQGSNERQRVGTCLARLKVGDQRIRSNKALLLLEIGVFRPQLLTQLFGACERVAQRCDACVESGQSALQPAVLVLHKLQLLFDVCQHLSLSELWGGGCEAWDEKRAKRRVSCDLHSGGGFFAKFMEFVVSLFNFFSERLILDFELLEIDQMQTLPIIATQRRAQPHTQKQANGAHSTCSNSSFCLTWSCNCLSLLES